MGFFSWNTADTNESIANIHSGHENAGITVYLLQPNGLPSIKEDAYDGYGVFGDVDAFAWLAKNNLPKELLEKIGDKEDELRTYGILLEFGEICFDKNNGKMYDYHYNHLFDDILPFDGNYMTKMVEYGKTPNELILNGTFLKKSFKDYLNIVDYKPLKFSFEDDAVYENLSASTDCEYQGYFYPDEDEDDYYEDDYESENN